MQATKCEDVLNNRNKCHVFCSARWVDHECIYKPTHYCTRKQIFGFKLHKTPFSPFTEVAEVLQSLVDAVLVTGAISAHLQTLTAV